MAYRRFFVLGRDILSDSTVGFLRGFGAQSGGKLVILILPHASCADSFGILAFALAMPLLMRRSTGGRGN